MYRMLFPIPMRGLFVRVTNDSPRHILATTGPVVSSISKYIPLHLKVDVERIGKFTSYTFVQKN